MAERGGMSAFLNSDILSALSLGFGSESSAEEEITFSPSPESDSPEGSRQEEYAKPKVCEPGKRCGDIYRCPYCGGARGMVELGLLWEMKVNGQTVYSETASRVPESVPGETAEEKAERIMKGYDVNPPGHKELQQPSKKKIFTNISYKSVINPGESVTVTFSVTEIKLNDPMTMLQAKWENGPYYLPEFPGWRNGRFTITPYGDPGTHRLYLQISDAEGMWDIAVLEFVVREPEPAPEPEPEEPEPEEQEPEQ